MKYGSIPAGGLGTRLQPIGFSKELAPVARRAVIEFLIERMIFAGIDKIFINTAEDKTDLIRYLAAKSQYKDNLIFMVRDRKGLLDGIVCPEAFLHEDDELFFGLPDTIWYPKDGFAQIDKQKGELVLGLFDTGTPEKFDSVVIDSKNKIHSIEVKVPNPKTKWTWAIGKLTVKVARALKPNALFGVSLHDYCQSHPGYAVELSGSSCLDIGIPDDYAKAEIFVKNHEH
ncbi:MAG: sugar phosphate nucleotidyltransferase [Microgenomates group bacterium]